MDTHVKTAPESLPPHLDHAYAGAHADYVALMLEELMDDTPAPKPVPTDLDCIVARAFADGMRVGKMLAICEMRGKLDAMGQPQ